MLSPRTGSEFTESVQAKTYGDRVTAMSRHSRN